MFDTPLIKTVNRLINSSFGYASSSPKHKSSNSGMYTVEGAFTIVIFTVLIMMLLSIINVVETEVEIQSAINQTAMQLSQYSYAVGNEIEIDNNETDVLKSIIQDVKREAVGFATGSALCETLSKSRIDEKHLALVDGGMDGLSFLGSNVLGDGKTITVVVIYRINVDMFGLVNKQLNICQKAQTAAWLPYYADKLAAVQNDSATGYSIWQETNFARGKYFVAREKDENAAVGVSSGQGIDLYDKETGTVTEIFSMNVFNSYYSFNTGDLKNPKDYSVNSETVKKQLDKYVQDYKKDIKQCGNTVLMDSGAEEQIVINEKQMILILPNEAKGQKQFENYFDEYKRSVKQKENIDLKIIYCEDAL